MSRYLIPSEAHALRRCLRLPRQKESFMFFRMMAKTAHVSAIRGSAQPHPSKERAMSSELRACPFCGGEPFGHAIEPHEHSQPLKALMPDLPDHKGSYVIECKCAAGYLRDTKEECEKAWNTRAFQPEGEAVALDTGNLASDPLYLALDQLYARGWQDLHKGRDYDPRGTQQWQDVLDLFRLHARPATGMGLTDEIMQALREARDTAMHYTMAARIPECGEFGGIAQNLDYVLQEIEAGQQWLAERSGG